MTSSPLPLKAARKGKLLPAGLGDESCDTVTPLPVASITAGENAGSAGDPDRTIARGADTVS